MGACDCLLGRYKHLFLRNPSLVLQSILPALEQLIYFINFDFIIKKALKYFQTHSELFYHDKCPGDSHCSLNSRQCVLSLNLPASLVVCVFMCSKYLLHKIFLPNNQLLLYRDPDKEQGYYGTWNKDTHNKETSIFLPIHTPHYISKSSHYSKSPTNV